jgi:DNA-binding beta-propeller fold protein YncE
MAPVTIEKELSMRSIKWLGLILTAALLLFCGCGGGSSSVSPIQPPSALSYTTATAVYIKGTAITPNSPTSTGGAVTSYSVSPALPAGLSLSTSTGIISGTPTAVTATASYTVTASNSAGSTTVTLTITVEDAAPAGLAYTTGTAVYTVGTAITPNSPSSTGGVVTSYSVSPDLPAGLSLDGNTGIISGTPTAVTAKAGYTVTASNATGSTTATLTITVNAAVAGVQFIPNMNQWITPLAPQGSQFQPLVTPWLVNGNSWLAGQAVSSVVSTDGNTLFVLTSGYNRTFYANSIAAMAFGAEGVVMPAIGVTTAPGGPMANSPSSEYVFIYDISTGTPIQKQAVMIPNSYNGIAFDPKQNAFYVSSGMGDYPFGSNGSPNPTTPQVDNVHVFTLSGKIWAPAPSTLLPGPELVLGHSGGGVGLPVANQGQVPINSTVYVQPCAAGVALSQDGQTMVVANYYNDSITVFTGGLGNWTPLSTLTAAEPGGLLNKGELDLRPGRAASSPQPGTPGGEYPFWVVIAQPPLPGGSTTTTWAYVSSIRDREIDVVNLDGGTPAVIQRIPVIGQPNKMTLNAALTRLYVAEDESDTVDVIDTNPNDSTTWNTVLETIPVIAPPSLVSSTPTLAKYTGANTDSVTLTPDGTQLYVTNGNLNSIAVVALTGTDKNDQVVGLIPTGWYPNSVSFSPNGQWVYVVNGKSPTGPNPNWCYVYGPALNPSCEDTNEYNPQLTKAGLQSFPTIITTPTSTTTLTTQLPALTAQVAANNHFSSTESASDAAVMAAVRQGIQHVIFIIKENRTYDQVLGDLDPGNGDPNLVQWGSTITPNLHNLAQTFVTLDNIMATSEVSYDGWLWSTGARAPDVVERQYPVDYAARGLSLDNGGLNRSVNVAIPTLAQRIAAEPLTPNDPDLLPGQTNVAAPDGPNNQVNTGYLWDAARRLGLTVRNYGFFIDGTCYNDLTPTCSTPLLTNPFASGTVVASPTNVTLAPDTDQYFRGFDNNFPDYYRYTEWARDFNTNYAKGGLPTLSLVYLMHDHTGNFGTAIAGVNTPELQQADNDYAVGLLVQTISSSIYANNTLIFVIEDDAQDGADHVDSHRTVAFVAGAYVKQHALVSTQYNTINFLRTIEEVLNLEPMNLNDALARPMADIFNTTPSNWSFTATPSPYLYATQLPLPQPAGVILVKSTHDATYWARVTKGLDFSDADRIDSAVYNRILWKGMMGDRPYPAGPTGLDLRQNRKELLANYRRSLKQEAAQKPKTVTN